MINLKTRANGYRSQVTGSCRKSVCDIGPVHSTPEEFEKAALFVRLVLPSTLIRHETELFGNLFQTE